MKLALCQTDIVWENKEKNYETAEKYIKKAAENKGELAVFPEMSFTGFTVNVSGMGEVFEESETVHIMRDMAKKYGIALGFGMIVTENGKNKNRFVIIDKDGNIAGYYDKIHPFSYSEEGKFFTGGNHITNVRIGDTAISLFVCYDLRFPEIFSCASYTCDLLLVIANWPASRINQWTHLLRARSIENQCYVAGINRTGTGDGIIYNGKSAVFDCYGNLLTEMDNHEGLAFCEIIPENVVYFRNKFRMKQDRREDLYKHFFDDLTPKKP